MAEYNSRRNVVKGVVCVITLTLAGCSSSQGGNATEEKARGGPDHINAMRVERIQEADRLAQCQKELEALKGIDAQRHDAYSAGFSRLMSGAAQYASLRPRVNAETQATVDALYTYKVNKLCADIRQASLVGLAERGESVK